MGHSNTMSYQTLSVRARNISPSGHAYRLPMMVDRAGSGTRGRVDEDGSLKHDIVQDIVGKGEKYFALSARHDQTSIGEKSFALSNTAGIRPDGSNPAISGRIAKTGSNPVSFHSVRDRIFLAVILTVTILIVTTSTVRRANYYNRSDPDGTLLTAQSLIQHGTIRLDAVGSPETMAERYRYRIVTVNGHRYYYFPLGSSLLAVPFVAAAMYAGMDMAEVPDDLAMQGWLSTLTLCLIGILMYRLCRFRLSEGPSLFLTLLFTWGTAVSSTCATALWSFNFQMVFILLALNILSGILQQPGPEFFRALWLGIALFMAYLCRPSAAVFVIGVLLLLAVRRKFNVLATTLPVILVLSAVFVMFSLNEYGAMLPPYYRMTRLAGHANMPAALAGLLISPSRGLLIFSPFFPVIFLFGRRTARGDRHLMVFAWFWLLVQIFSVARFPHWWGGHSFGARVLTDGVPAILLMAILILSGLAGRPRRVFLVMLAVTGTAAVAINTGQGLYNRSTIRWNFYPEIDPNPEYLFNWRYPQFLSTPGNLEERMQRHRERAGAGAGAGTSGREDERMKRR